MFLVLLAASSFNSSGFLGQCPASDWARQWHKEGPRHFHPHGLLYWAVLAGRGFAPPTLGSDGSSTQSCFLPFLFSAVTPHEPSALLTLTQHLLPRVCNLPPQVKTQVWCEATRTPHQSLPLPSSLATQPPLPSAGGLEICGGIVSLNCVLPG